MSKLESLLGDFEKALLRFEEVLQVKKKDKIVRDSAIKRFEFTFDLAWKTIKTFLEENKGLICASPKGCLREAYKQGVVEYDDFWVDMAQYRNKTVHIYKEELAEEIYKILPKTFKYFQKLLDNIREQLKTETF